jgi:Isochorismatase family
VIVVGTTSGCVRATVVDAFSLNYRVTLAEEGCFDRSEASHAVSLCDMHAKYADVLPTAEILSYFDQLPNDLFDLPTGMGGPKRRSRRRPNKDPDVDVVTLRRRPLSVAPHCGVPASAALLPWRRV